MAKKFLRWVVLLELIFTIGVNLAAQEFKVQQFRILPNDISAYIAPEYDLNHEACALLKVVCEGRFAFSTPLGIVRRKDEVGEVWLYMPRNTRMITLKHPQWGVLRDYVFPVVLESRMTYELVVESPMNVRKDWFLRVAPRREQLAALNQPGHSVLRRLPEMKMMKVPLRWEAFVSASVSAGSDVLPGIRMGILKKHGVYLSAYSNFGNLKRQEVGVCDDRGYMPSEGYTPYYKGHVSSGELLFLAGTVHRLHRSWYIYEGVGYGMRKVYWQLLEGGWARNTDHSAEGWTSEVGAIYRRNHCMVSGGVLTLCGSYWMGTLSVGFVF